MLHQAWWPTLLISAHRRQQQEDLYEFMAILVYLVSSRQPRLHSANLYKKKDHNFERKIGLKVVKKERRKRRSDVL